MEFWEKKLTKPPVARKLAVRHAKPGYWWFKVLGISKCMHGLQACLFKYFIVAAFRIYALLSMVKMPLKGEDGGCALNSHGNYIVDHGNLWKNHEIVFLNFCGNPGLTVVELVYQHLYGLAV